MKFDFKQRFLKRKEEPLKAENRFMLENKTFLRLSGNLLILFVVFSIVLTSLTFRDSLFKKTVNELENRFYAYIAMHGFNIEDIIVEGRQKTSLEDLSKIIDLTRQNSILEVDLKDLKEKIEQLPWIEKAEVKRLFFPNIIQISLKEKEIIALYQTDGPFYPIDKDGQVIKADFVPQKEFLIVVGEGAPQKLFELFSVTTTTPELHDRIKGVVLNSNRRWDLVFDDLEHGMTIKMPENDLERAWKKLIKINNQYGIFKRKLTFIDLRYQDKVIVKVAD